MKLDENRTEALKTLIEFSLAAAHESIQQNAPPNMRQELEENVARAIMVLYRTAYGVLPSPSLLANAKLPRIDSRTIKM